VRPVISTAPFRLDEPFTNNKWALLPVSGPAPMPTFSNNVVVPSTVVPP